MISDTLPILLFQAFVSEKLNKTNKPKMMKKEVEDSPMLLQYWLDESRLKCPTAMVLVALIPNTTPMSGAMNRLPDNS